MALYARVENGVIVERRDLASPPPAHKAAQWKAIVDPGQPQLAAGQIAIRSEQISGSDVVASYQVVTRPTDDLRAMIKNEAQRRIIAATGASSFEACITKQLNALMRSTELTNKKASGQSLSDAENAEAAALQTLANAIKALRAKSDALESSLPVDYTSDHHWA